MRHVLIAMLAVCVMAVAAQADWDLGMDYKMHYPQLPDLTDHGLDVLDCPGAPEEVIVDPQGGQIVLPAIPQKMLADDWRCSGTGRVTDIHIWGSWLNDLVSPAPIGFRLTIYDNIPEGPTGEPSMPGTLLWEYDALANERVYIRDLYEQFYDPNKNEIIGRDTMCWQYNFYINPDEAFRQELGKIYWLGVEAFYPMRKFFLVGEPPNEWLEVEEYYWGWKTSGVQHFMDDAVFRDWIEDPADPGLGYWGNWIEMYHPETGESLDLAFVITPEPATMALLGLGLVGLVAKRKTRK